MKGTIANVAAIALGSGLGLLLRKGIPERYKTTIMQGLSLAVFLIGVQMAQKTENILVVIASIVIGAIMGEWWDLDSKLEHLGKWVEQKLHASSGSISKGFVASSLIYCVGAMAVIGAIQDGMTGNAEVLYVKSALDGISSIIFTSTLGAGVFFSAAPVFIYQGLITLMANYVGPIMTSAVIAEMTATGGLLIIGIALNMLDVKQIKVVNLLPSILVAVGIALIVK